MQAKQALSKAKSNWIIINKLNVFSNNTNNQTYVIYYSLHKPML